MFLGGPPLGGPQRCTCGKYILNIRLSTKVRSLTTNVFDNLIFVKNNLHNIIFLGEKGNFAGYVPESGLRLTFVYDKYKKGFDAEMKRDNLILNIVGCILILFCLSVVGFTCLFFSL